MRIAFLTPEYPTEVPDGGGLGNYIHRFAKLLIGSGHEAEVFVIGAEPGSFVHDGVPVHRVGLANHRLLHFVDRGLAKLFHYNAFRQIPQLVLQAWAMAHALERRHTVAPFGLVQSADYFATGLLVRKRKDRVHAIRCSTAADLYSDYDGPTFLHSLRAGLERLSMRRADVAYAPSCYIANHFLRAHGIKVSVVRPPLYLECSASSSLPFSLPDRFFLHFGQLMERKGTALLAKALPIAWEAAPDLTMVWSGRCWHEEKLAEWRSLWGTRASQIHITGPLRKPDLYAVLQQAEAAVLPSQVDNLPNTVIESLMFGVPVLGSRGASIDELVEDGRTGHLVPLGDEKALGEMLARMWRGASYVRKGFVWDSQIVEEMQPPHAVSNLLALAEGCVPPRRPWNGVRRFSVSFLPKTAARQTGAEDII